MLQKKKFITKNAHDELVKKVNAIDTNQLVIKTNYNAKIYEIKDEIPTITGLAATASLNAVENKILKVSDLVKKKTDYDAKIKEIERKHFTTSDYNKFTHNIIDAKIKQKNQSINLIFPIS